MDEKIYDQACNTMHKMDEKIYDQAGNIIEIKTDEIEKLYNNNKLHVENDKVKTWYNLGVYYYEIKNYTEAVKYYMMAYDNDNDNAMNNLGFYYDVIEKNYPEAIKYYLMAIEKGNSDAMYNLGQYYYEIEKNYTEANKYLKMSVEKGDSDAMCNLGFYYEYIENNYPEAIKYYLMAIEKGNDYAMDNLKMITIPLERYMLFEKHDIAYTENHGDIQIYKNKLKYSKIDDCGICLVEKVQVIQLSCFGHFCCTDCYPKVYNKKCPFCRL